MGAVKRGGDVDIRAMEEDKTMQSQGGAGVKNGVNSIRLL